MYGTFHLSLENVYGKISSITREVCTVLCHLSLEKRVRYISSITREVCTVQFHLSLEKCVQYYLEKCLRGKVSNESVFVTIKMFLTIQTLAWV